MHSREDKSFTYPKVVSIPARIGSVGPFIVFFVLSFAFLIQKKYSSALFLLVVAAAWTPAFLFITRVYSSIFLDEKIICQSAWPSFRSVGWANIRLVRQIILPQKIQVSKSGAIGMPPPVKFEIFEESKSKPQIVFLSSILEVETLIQIINERAAIHGFSLFVGDGSNKSNWRTEFTQVQNFEIAKKSQPHSRVVLQP